MRMEELENNRYIKSTDSVEKYLLNIIQEYFKSSKDAVEGSKEYIIKEAVDRLKSEMDYNSLGVLSITLPNGEVRKGDVTLTLEDLNGEPKIDPKHSAFNVDFGNQEGTACEGNDPRLSDKRVPLAHTHEIKDVKDLEGILSTLKNKLDRSDALSHTHNNKDVLDKLTYSGTKDVIDLTILDTLQDDIDKETDKIHNDLKKYINETNERIDEITNSNVDISKEIQRLKTYVDDQNTEYLKQSKSYTNEKINDSINEINENLEKNYVKKTDLSKLIDIAKNCYTYVGTQKWDLSSVINTAGTYIRTISLPLSEDILNELQKRAIDIMSNTNDLIMEFSLTYTKDGKTVTTPLPFMDSNLKDFGPSIYPIRENTSIGGYIENIQNNKDSIEMIIMSNAGDINISGAYIICNIYSKEPTGF